MLVFIIFFVAVVTVAVVFYMLGRGSVKLSERVKVDTIERCVDELLNLETVTQLAREHKEQNACLKELKNLFCNYFFFREFARPKDAYNDLIRRRDKNAKHSWGAVEDEAIVAMYNEMINEINPSWLEEVNFKTVS